MSLSGADAAHLVVAVALTYLLRFERDLRGAPTGDRVFALVGAGSNVIGIIAAHGAGGPGTSPTMKDPRSPVNRRPDH